MLCIFRLLIFGKTKNKHTNGGVAQLGEHLPCKQGVMGSNPIISTNPEGRVARYRHNFIEKVR